MSIEWRSPCKTSTFVGQAWSCTLSVQNLDKVYGVQSWAIPEDRWPRAAALAAGGVASMGPSACAGGNGIVGSGHSTDGAIAYWFGNQQPFSSLPEDMQAAVDEWVATFPADVDIWWASVLVATVTAPGASDHVYKCVGMLFPGPGVPAPGYHGDTHWELDAAFSISNVRCKAATGDASSENAALTYPRAAVQRYATYGLYVDETTVTTATLGDMSVCGTYELPCDPETGQVDIDQATGLNLYTSIELPWCVDVDTSFAEVQSITCGGNWVSPNLTLSCWAVPYSTAPVWIGSIDKPSDPDIAWHCFNDGNTIKLHLIRPAMEHAAITTITQLSGPVRWNIRRGRFGFDGPEVADGFRVDVGLRRMVDEDPTHAETIWLYEGLSDPYTWSLTYPIFNAEAALRQGQTFWGSGPYVVDPEWLEANGELLESGGEAPVCTNRYLKIAIPSLQGDIGSTNPYYQTVIYGHEDISADIPPGQSDRPSKWFIGGVESGYADPQHPLNPTWTITAALENVTRSLLSRKPLRLDYLCTWTQQTPPIAPYNPDWPMINRANFSGAGDTPAMVEAIPIEDVVNYDNSRLLEVSLAKCPAGIDPATLVLRLVHSHFGFTDTNYVPPNYGSTFRFGAGSDFASSYQRTQRTDDFYGSGVTSPADAPDEGWTFLFDLAQLRRDNTTHLQHVDSIAIIGLPEGDYELSDWRLIEDPSSHQ